MKTIRRTIANATGTITVYHGSHMDELAEVVPGMGADNKRMSSLGTWFTSSIEHAKIYGPQVYAAELDADPREWFPAHTDDFAKSWYSAGLAQKHLTPTEKELADAYYRGDKKPPPSYRHPRLRDRWQTDAQEAMYKLLRNWEYLTAFRANIQKMGFKGIVWRKSKIDSPKPHDVYLVFDKVKTKGKIQAVIARAFGRGHTGIRQTILGARKLWWHGTSARNLRGILKHGLIPDPKEKTFDDSSVDPGRSLLPYGGVYLSDNLGVAFTFAQFAEDVSGGGEHFCLVGVTLETRSPQVHVDEDNILTMLENMGSVDWPPPKNVMRNPASALRRTGETAQMVWDLLNAISEEWPDALGQGDGTPTWAKNLALNVVVTWQVHMLEQAFKSRSMEVPAAFQNSFSALRTAVEALSNKFRVMKEEPTISAHKIRVKAPITYRGQNRILYVIELARDQESGDGWQATFHHGSPDSAVMGLLDDYLAGEEVRTAEVEMQEPRPRPEEEEFPFEAQCDFQGIKIDIENKKGSTRSGTDPNGKKWSVTMNAHYGEIRKSEGADGDKLDVYVGPDETSQWVFVVHQNHPSDHPEKPGEYDEDKVMLGYRTPNEALTAYKVHYDNAGEIFGGLGMLSITRFKEWLTNPESAGEAVQWKPR